MWVKVTAERVTMTVERMRGTEERMRVTVRVQDGTVVKDGSF